MAYFLYTDTSGSTATVAISDTDQVLQVIQHHNAQEQAAVINTMVATVLSQAQLQLQDMSAFALCAGPGSYTGLRVGISTVKGLAFALNKPLLLFNSLDILQAGLPSGNKAVVLKARLDEYFMATYQNEQTLLGPQHAFVDSLKAKISTDFEIYTDDVHSLLNLGFEKEKIHQLDHCKGVNIAAWLPLVVKRYTQQQFDDIAYSEPFYLKAAFTTTPKK